MDSTDFTPYRPSSAARILKAAGATICLFVLFSCAHGNLVLYPLGQENIDTFVSEKYPELEASYSGSLEKPGALRFDIKGDGIQLTGPGWQPLESKEAVLQVVRNMQHTYLGKYKGEVGAVGPRLYTIMSDNNQPIGYIYTPMSVPVRPDGKNYQVDAITETDVRNYVYPWREPSPRPARGGRR